MEKHIEELNKKLLQSVGKTYPVGLAQGQMGLCVYFYHLSRIEQNEHYKVVAEKLLDDTLGKLSQNTSVDVEKGLAGMPYPTLLHAPQTNPQRGI